MPDSPAQAIKEKLDIVEFLKAYLALTPAGRNFKALCPFHREKTPSFMVSPDRQTWHCFGCGLGGDLFSFIMKYENIEFGEALRTLAEKAGIELKRVNPAEYKFVGLLYDLNDAAKIFFRKELERSPVAKKYLEERGLAEETIDEFDLGWAPNTSDSLTMHFLNAGHSPDDLLRAGLSFKTERGMTLDRFRGRIMFPIHNHLGKVVGFTGRILPELDNGQSGKYINSPETPIFAKSKLLYGFWKTKNAIRDAGFAFLVEGQMDMLMSAQAGVRNVVASSGTAFTPDHLRALRRQTDRLVLSFDSDEAGLAAGERVIDLAEAGDFEVKVVLLKGFKDPADLAKADPQKLAAAVASARPAPEFYFERYLPNAAVDPRNRDYLKRIRAVLAKIKNIASPVGRSFWMKELSRRANIGEKILAEEADRIEVRAPAAISGEAKEEEIPEKKFSRREMLSQRLIALALHKNDFSAAADSFRFLGAPYADIAKTLQSGEKTTHDLEKDTLIDIIMLQPEEAGPMEFEEIKAYVEQEYYIDRRRELAEAVRRAENAGDESALRSALAEFNQLPVV